MHDTFNMTKPSIKTSTSQNISPVQQVPSATKKEVSNVSVSLSSLQKSLFKTKIGDKSEILPN